MVSIGVSTLQINSSIESLRHNFIEPPNRYDSLSHLQLIQDHII